MCVPATVQPGEQKGSAAQRSDKIIRFFSRIDKTVSPFAGAAEKPPSNDSVVRDEFNGSAAVSAIDRIIGRLSAFL
jgi:hypothetical protein